jgi:hypothetical protein
MERELKMLKFRVLEQDGWFEFHVYSSDLLFALRMLRKTYGDDVRFEVLTRGERK